MRIMKINLHSIELIFSLIANIEILRLFTYTMYICKKI